jgi:hypothetical protein
MAVELEIKKGLISIAISEMTRGGKEIKDQLIEEAYS